MAPQAGPKISPLGMPLPKRSPFRWIKKTAFARRPAPRHAGQGTAARRRALLSGATPATAKQHGGVCFHRARALAARRRNSTAACASTWRHVNSQSTAARRRALPQSGHGATSTARAQQHGGARFCRSGHGSQGTAARRRALLSDATSARAKQHGGVCFHRARRVGPGPPSLSLWPWVAGFFLP
jgi:hypothetical protein